LFGQGGRSILRQYQGSLTAALQHLFPDVCFDLEKFVQIRPSMKQGEGREEGEITNVNVIGEHFSTPRNRREFFVEFAVTRQLDPLVPQSWYHNPISYWLRKTTVCFPTSTDILDY
jgi:hypothetical protein